MRRGVIPLIWLACLVATANSNLCFAQGEPTPPREESAEAEAADPESDEGDDEDSAANEYPLDALFGPLAHGAPGFDVYYVYTADTFTNAHGGLNTSRATEFRGNLDLTITIDLDHFGLSPGGEFFLYFQEGHGRGISEPHVGDYQGVSNIDFRDLTQLSEYWWRRTLCEERLWFKLGKQDATNDFSSTDAAGGFCNNGFWNPYNIPLPASGYTGSGML